VPLLVRDRIAPRSYRSPMALKKPQLYSSLWKSCDELRGGMDASQYKDYVLTLLFMKFVSDKYGGKNAVIDVPRAAASPTWSNSRATRRAATRSTRSSPASPKPTTSRASSTSPLKSATPTLPHAPLRDRIRQEQGPVLHPRRGLPRHRQGRRRRQRHLGVRLYECEQHPRARSLTTRCRLRTSIGRAAESYSVGSGFESQRGHHSKMPKGSAKLPETEWA
jgi:HsdM-like protein